MKAIRDPVGSKSPFALVDSFNIESYKNGIKYTGLWYKKECGTPLLIIIDKAPTQEPNGLKFIVPALPEHTKEFIDAFNKQLFNFHLKPLFFYDINDSTTQYEFDYKYKEKLSFKNVKVFSVDSTERHLTRVFISIGGVLYPYSSLKISDDIYKYVLNSTVNRDYQTPILVLELPIGSVTIPMNRESIEESKTNIEFIQKQYESLEIDWINFTYQHICTYIEDCTTNKKEFTIEEFVAVYKTVFSDSKNSTITLPTILNDQINFNFNFNLTKYARICYNNAYSTSLFDYASGISPNRLKHCVTHSLSHFDSQINDFNFNYLKPYSQFKRETGRYKNKYTPFTSSTSNLTFVRKDAATSYLAARLDQYVIQHSLQGDFVLVSGPDDFLDEYFRLLTEYSKLTDTTFSVIIYEDLPKVVKVKKPKVITPVVTSCGSTANVIVPEEVYFKGIYEVKLTVDRVISKHDNSDKLLSSSNYNSKYTESITTTDVSGNKIKVIDYLNNYNKVILINSELESLASKINYWEIDTVHNKFLNTLFAAGFEAIFYCTPTMLNTIKESNPKFIYLELSNTFKEISQQVETYLLTATEILEEKPSNFYYLFIQIVSEFIEKELRISNYHKYSSKREYLKSQYLQMLEFLYNNTPENTLILNKSLDAFIRKDVTKFFQQIYNFNSNKTNLFNFYFLLNKNLTLDEKLEDLLLAYYIYYEEEICNHLETSVQHIYDLIIKTEYYRTDFYSFIPQYSYITNNSFFENYLVSKILTKLNITWSNTHE